MKPPESATQNPHAGPAYLPGGRSRVAEPLRRRMEQAVIGLTSGAGAPRVDFLQPPGDPGLFGPDSVCWKVHADFTVMIVGGVCALLLQALHPLALAGVWDHSNFREDILGRLRRTSAFVGGVTFASRGDAQRLIERVKRIHTQVTGTAPDGRPYAAGDPELLTWVHVAEHSSFLRSWQRYAFNALDAAQQDRYYAEVAVVAELLGARGVPKSAAEVDAYLERMRAELVCDARAREVRRILFSTPAPSLAIQPFSRLILHAGEDLMPEWAQAMFGLRPRAGLRRAALRASVRGMVPPFRWALRNGAAGRAKVRTHTRGT